MFFTLMGAWLVLGSMGHTWRRRTRIGGYDTRVVRLCVAVNVSLNYYFVKEGGRSREGSRGRLTDDKLQKESLRTSSRYLPRAGGRRCTRRLDVARLELTA